MITALVGGQFGSEGKGLVAGHLAGSFDVHVRVGAANAGHTVYVEGRKCVLQQIPCAAYANPHAKLVLGAGAMISPGILLAELEENIHWRRVTNQPPLRLYIDHRAHIVTARHIAQEQQTDLAERIGSTSTVAKEGIGAAQAARVMRTDYAQIGERYDQLALPGREDEWCRIDVVDTVRWLHQARLFGSNILLEGTQGAGLSNTTGFYPYVTSRNTSAAGLAADCGIGPRDLDSVIMVVRTYPIRVAGNSGPFYPDSEEITWDRLHVDEGTERTTVTKKVRRVATFSWEQLMDAVRINSPTEIAVTFADYMAPHIRDVSGAQTAQEFTGWDWVGPMVRKIEDLTGIPVTYVGTGPATMIDRESQLLSV